MIKDAFDGPFRPDDVEAPPGSKVACVLSGGNIDLTQLSGLRSN